MKRDREASDTDIRRRMKSAPSLVLAREVIYFLIITIKECLKFVKLNPLPQFTF